MRPMSKFEKKFGKYAIHNLTSVLIACYVLGYVLLYTFPTILNYLTLNPYLILRGQVWRLVTWIIMPPGGDILSVIITLFFYWSIGTTLERTWGTYRYNVYLFSGMIFTVLGSFVLMGYYYLTKGAALAVSPEVTTMFFQQASLYFSTYYVNMSIFLAFAATFPEVQVLLMFIIPIKVKWMGFVYGIILFWNFITINSAAVRIAMVASLLNFVLFYLTSRRLLISPKQMRRQQKFKREVHRSSQITRHKCAICGRTNESNPELEFRFCSKCNGNYEYCQDHLFTHKHVE